MMLALLLRLRLLLGQRCGCSISKASVANVARVVDIKSLSWKLFASAKPAKGSSTTTNTSTSSSSNEAVASVAQQFTLHRPIRRLFYLLHGVYAIFAHTIASGTDIYIHPCSHCLHTASLLLSPFFGNSLIVSIVEALATFLIIFINFHSCILARKKPEKSATREAHKAQSTKNVIGKSVA